MGFLYQLGNVSIPVLEQQCEWFRSEKPKSPRSDSLLYLSITRSPDAVKTALSFALNCNLKGGLQWDNIDRLIHALKRANEKTASDYDANAPVYNKETCVDFHHLLLGLLLAHRQSLIARRGLADGEKKSKQTKRATELRNKLGDTATAGNVTEVEGSLYSDENYGRINADVWNYSDLLWRVVSSQAYHDHLEVIKPLIHKPVEHLKGTYSKWFRDAGLEVMTEERNREEVGNGQEAKGTELLCEDEFGNSDDVRSGFDSFKQWMSLHVSYFEALRILSLNRNVFHCIKSSPQFCGSSTKLAQ